MRRLFLIFILFHSFISASFAADLTAIVGAGYRLPQDINVEYDGSKVKGVETELLKEKVYSDLSSGGYRKNNYAEYLAVPPKTEITFFLWAKNNTDTIKDIFSIDLYMSRSNIISGDLTRLGAYGETKTLPYVVNGITKTRTSKVNHIELSKTYLPFVNSLAFEVYGFEIQPPIKIVDFSYDVTRENNHPTVKYSVTVLNNSEYILCGLEIIEFAQKFCLNPHQQLDFSNTVVENEDKVVRKVHVYDPNHHYEATTSQLLNVSDLNPESSPGLLNTTNGIIPVMGEEIKNLTVELLPYTIVSDEKEIPLTQKIESEIELVGSILNIKLVNQGVDLKQPKLQIKNGEYISVHVIGDLKNGEEVNTSRHFDLHEGVNLFEIWIISDFETQLLKSLQIDIPIKPAQSKDQPVKKAVTISNQVSSKNHRSIKDVKLFKEDFDNVKKDLKGISSQTNTFIPEKVNKVNSKLYLYLLLGIVAAICLWILIRLW